MNCEYCHKFNLVCTYCYRVLNLISITGYADLITDYNLFEYLHFKINE